jgi:hypothetical protein
MFTPEHTIMKPTMELHKIPEVKLHPLKFNRPEYPGLIIEIPVNSTTGRDTSSPSALVLIRTSTALNEPIYRTQSIEGCNISTFRGI